MRAPKPIEKVKTVADWAEHWLAVYKKGSVKQATYRGYTDYINKHIVPVIGHLKLSQVKPAHIQKLINDESAGGSSMSLLRHIRVTLNQLFATAIDNGFCADNPVTRTKLPSKPKTEIEAFREGDVKKIVEYIPWHKFGLAIALLLYTGLRRGELLALQWSCVNLEENMITVRQAVVEAEAGFDIDVPKAKENRLELSLSSRLCPPCWRVSGGLVCM